MSTPKHRDLVPTMPLTYHHMPEQRLRVAGYAVVSVVFLFLFMPCKADWEKDAHLFAKTLLVTLVHCLVMWEPTRLLILKLQKSAGGMLQVQRRLRILISVAIPYAMLLGFVQNYLAEQTTAGMQFVTSWGSYAYTSGITLLFMLLQIAIYESIYFFGEWSRSTAEAEEIKRLNVQVQMDSLKVQIQPHFLFNTLNTLIGLIEINKVSAINFTQNLAYVYRYLLQANEQPVISLEEEIKFAYAYFLLLKTRYANCFEMSVEALESHAFQLPPLTLQILIENAVKHNTITKACPLHVYIYLDHRKQQLLVQNNYRPRPVKNSTGLGLEHLKKKFSLLGLPHLEVRPGTEEFIVCIPLQKTSEYENPDHRRRTDSRSKVEGHAEGPYAKPGSSRRIG